MGGKNSMFNKPLGTGKKSVAHNPLNITPIWSGSVGGIDTGLGASDKIDAMQKGDYKRAMLGNLAGGTTGDASNPYGNFAQNKQEAMKAMDFGTKKGEVMTGGSMAEAGEGRAKVRDRLEQVFQGNSAGANRLAESQAADAKQMKARQAMGGGGQMSEGQRAAQENMQNRQLAGFVSDEKRHEYRGMAGDIMKSSGQYGSIIMGAQPPAQPQSSGGLTVICTELHRQGYMSDAIYEADRQYGQQVRATRMHVYVGYRFLADPVVVLMQKNKLFTALISIPAMKWANNMASIPAMKWANNMAGNKNLIGSIIGKIGESFCGFVGKIIMEKRNELKISNK
jgi:hypothetical protein